MDQDHFRNLLTSSSNGKSSSRHSAPAPKAQKPSAKSKLNKGESSAEPAFKPRAVKKSATKESAYRDRASERRTGKESDYAQIEALAEDFEKRAAAEKVDQAMIEEQRKYLGGDGDHSVLVKGLDFALLEQNKAKLLPTVDDDTLEQAFIEGASAEPTTTAGPSSKKRTREEIIHELKTKRPKTDAVAGTEKDLTLDDAKRAGKFKPIGFKPIGSVGDGKKKKVKKAKVEKKNAKGREGDEEGKAVSTVREEDEEMKVVSSRAAAPPQPDPEPVPEDFDIFADAGEYTGLDLGDDDDDDDEAQKRRSDSEAEDTSRPAKANWFDDKEDGEVPPPQPETKSASLPPQPEQQEPDRSEEGEEEEEDTPVRLAPLASSSMPSIKEILAMDDAAQKEQKRKARKEKKKGALGVEGKVDRDYQRLKSYTEKKAAAS